MKIKHTLLATIVFLVLGWHTDLFAYNFGPPPGVNGTFGTNTCFTGCHNSFQVNSGTGSVTINGLPATWTPGQTYALSVVVAQAGRQIFGFQLSAVSDTTPPQQAGTLAAGNTRARVICGRNNGSDTEVPCTTAGAIQFAQHANAQLATSTYLVNWTAPASASFGTVRFNVAGNAANGDLTNQGDFIYTRVQRVDPASAPPDLSIRAFTMVDRGGVSVITDGSGDAATIGYSRIRPDSGKTTPSGVSIFGLRQGGTLVTEAGVPASPLLTSARIYAEVTGGVVNTGLAIANPNDTPATINFHFTDAAGVDFGNGSKVIDANSQIAAFLDEAPYNALVGRTSVQGTFTLTSTVPVSLVALRGFYNERSPSEFLITTLPVTDLSAATAAGIAYLPHFADGVGWTTQIVLVNPTDSTITGTVQFVGKGNANIAGVPVPVGVQGQATASASYTYTIPRQSSFKLVTAGTTPAPTLSGTVRVTAVTGVTPSSLVIFSYKPGAITVSEAGVPGIQGTAFRMYAEETATGGIGAIQTGFAIANLGGASTTVNLDLTKLDGTPAGSTTVDVPGNGQIATFLHEVFPALAFPFQGILRISGGAAAGMSVVGLRGRYNERSDFLITTTPPSDENQPATGAELLFPHVVNGGGYTTQFILFSGSSGQASSGTLTFRTQGGLPFNLTVN